MSKPSLYAPFRDRARPHRRALLGLVILALAATPALASGPDSAVNFLLGRQEADGGWTSASVRRAQATSEALLALQVAAPPSSARARAAAFLEASPAEDTEDRARRIAALLGEHRDVSAAVAQLVADASPDGGWGLFPDFAPDPLDTSLALSALAGAPGVSPDVLGRGVTALLAARHADGGWPCVDQGENDLYCSGLAVQAVASYRTRFFVETELATAVAFLRSQLNPDGSFGPPGPDHLLQTAAAALGLAAAQATGAERLTVIGYLLAQQQADGSWGADPFTTATVLRALRALLTVPVCGDGVINRASEGCDGLDFGGKSCDSLGLGPGTLACSPTCTLDTTGCSAPPACGDGVRNQSTESCDGSDLGGASCQSVGFLGGTLACTPDCSFDAAGCTGVPRCGDGVVNRPEEQCDGGDLAGATCNALGLLGGSLGCSTTCSFVTTGCTGTGQTLPRSIEIPASSPVCTGGTATLPVSITFPESSTIDKVDVFLLFDDTGSFAGGVPAVQSIFSALVSDLQAALPGVSFGFGVGRFEDFGGPGTGFSGEFSTGRPFTLNQPIITTDVASFSSLIAGALNRTAPGFGGDGPETTLDALAQIATGAGLDGNGNGSTLDSGLAGATATQTSPGTSGDVPAFASNVAPTSGTLGGVGFRPRALHLVIEAGDICSVAAYAAGTVPPLSITGVGGVTLPSSALRCSNTLGFDRFGFVSNSVATAGNTVPNAVAPKGATTVPATVSALNALGIQVIGLAPGGTAIRNPVGPSSSPSVGMSAMALLTGAIDASGNPLVFNISGGTTPIRNAIVAAVTTAATRPLDVTLRPVGTPTGLSLSFTPAVVPDVGPGQSAAFDVTFDGDGSVLRGAFSLEFVDVGGNTTLGSVPVTLACLPGLDLPPDADGDGFRADVDCDDTNPAVNPGAHEIPGNGIDDDCNPATPDTIPANDVVCVLKADRVSYLPGSDVHIDADLTSLSDASLVGIEGALAIDDSGGALVDTLSRSLAPLAPGARVTVPFTVGTGNKAPGEYLASLVLAAGTGPLASCQVSFRVESTAETGVGLGGTIAVDPAVVNAGAVATVAYSVRNQGNVPLTGLPVKVLVVDPDSSQVMVTLTDTATLAVGGILTNHQPLATAGLASKTYLVLLQVTVAGTAQTLATTTVTIVNAPPDCSKARASIAELFPPNHKLVQVSVESVTDPDGDPLAITVNQVRQDEPTNALGDGNTCPDAVGTGTSTVSVRAERSGQGDGRVYHLLFVAADGRGGTCGGEVTVCVPHDQGRSGVSCVDQGPVFDSTACTSLAGSDPERH